MQQRNLNKIQGTLTELNNKVKSIHPVAALGVMTAFAFPAMALSHSTSNLALHTTIKNLSLGFSIGFAAFFIVVFALKMWAQLKRAEVKKVQISAKSKAFFATFSCLGLLCLGGAMLDGLLISQLDHNISHDAKLISKDTALLNYLLLTSAVFIFIAYCIYHMAVNKKIEQNDESQNLGTWKSMQNTSNLWLVFTMAIGIGGAYALHASAEISHTAIMFYSLILFSAALVIAVPKMIYAFKKYTTIAMGEGNYERTGKLAFGATFVGVSLLTVGIGIGITMCGNPLNGSAVIVAGMGLLAFACYLFDRSSKEMEDQLANNQNDENQQPMMDHK